MPFPAFVLGLMAIVHVRLGQDIGFALCTLSRGVEGRIIGDRVAAYIMDVWSMTE